LAAELLEPLIPGLQVIEDLRERLTYVKWSRENLALLDQAARDLLQIVQDPPHYARIAATVSRLAQQTGACLSHGQLPQGVAREELLATLDDLCCNLPQADAWTMESRPRQGDRTAVLRGEILLLADHDMNILVVELEGAGFQVRRVNTFTELRDLLAETLPVAFIVDMDFSEGELFASFNMVADQDDRFDRKAPLFFISERSDLAARLEAVSAGGRAYFTKPVNIQALSEALYERLQAESLQGYRVLIVSDNPAEAQRLVNFLQHKAIVTQVVEQPLEVIRLLHRFQPQLLLLDLDIRTVNGVELAMAIRQHETFSELPMLILSAQVNLNPYLAELGAGGDDLLRKPVGAEYLLAAVTNRLHRARTLSYKLSHLGQKDTVTGLYNRRYFLEQLERAVAKNRSITVMLITLDNLRELEARDVNLADAVLEQVARRLQAGVEPGQQLARFGDAMFAVLLSGADREALLDTARTLRTALETEPYTVDSESLRLRTSVGISTAMAEEQDWPYLIQQADMACLIAREAGQESWRERIHVYNPQADWEATVLQRQRLLEEIQEALQQRRLSLVFQPIVSLRGDTTARYEALLRMRNQEGQELLPETVFGVVQNHRLGLLLERWVIANAIRLLRERQAHNQPTTLFVNISPAVLQDEAIVEWIKTALERTGIHPDQLVFEMAEANAEKHLPSLCRFVEAVRNLGCGFSLDRFNGGEVGRTLLGKLAVDYVKLDPHFVYDLSGDESKQQELQQLAQALEALQITTVASSIENLATLQALGSCGMNYVQGFFLQVPHTEMTYNFASGAS
jgi:diguanylate cyclase (GGDEF)-like protein